MTIALLDLELSLTQSRILYAAANYRGNTRSALDESVKSAVAIWLQTNMVSHVRYYEGKSFVRTSRPMPKWHSSSRASLDGRTLPPVSRALHIIRNVDVPLSDRDTRDKAGKNMGEFLVQRHENRDYVIFVGAKDERWWNSQEWTKSGEGQREWLGGEYWEYGRFWPAAPAGAVDFLL